MTSLLPQRITSIDEVAADYEAVFCDVWGVIHDGIAKFGEAEAALTRVRASGRKVALVTNSPRPAQSVVDFLDMLCVSREAYDFVSTSGDVTRALISAAPRRVFHIGLKAHLALFEGMDVECVDEGSAETIIVTGLANGDEDAPEAYADLLERLAARNMPMICANPDIVAPKGDRMVWGAGALARDYAERGGRTLLAGKPFASIYDHALALVGGIDKARILAIGDGLDTDIKGANDFGLDALLILSGIHADTIGATLEEIAASLLQQGRTAKFVMQHLK